MGFPTVQQYWNPKGFTPGVLRTAGWQATDWRALDRYIDSRKDEAGNPLPRTQAVLVAANELGFASAPPLYNQLKTGYVWNEVQQQLAVAGNNLADKVQPVVSTHGRLPYKNRSQVAESRRINKLQIKILRGLLPRKGQFSNSPQATFVESFEVANRSYDPTNPETLFWNADEVYAIGVTFSLGSLVALKGGHNLTAAEETTVLQRLGNASDQAPSLPVLAQDYHDLTSYPRGSTVRGFRLENNITISQSLKFEKDLSVLANRVNTAITQCSGYDGDGAKNDKKAFHKQRAQLLNGQIVSDMVLNRQGDIDSHKMGHHAVFGSLLHNGFPIWVAFRADDAVTESVLRNRYSGSLNVPTYSYAEFTTQCTAQEHRQALFEYTERLKPLVEVANAAYDEWKASLYKSVDDEAYYAFYSEFLWEDLTALGPAYSIGGWREWKEFYLDVRLKVESK